MARNAQPPALSPRILGADKWGAGPTAVALKQAGKVTYGVLVNQFWSVAGNDLRPDISQAFVQPFMSYTTSKSTTFGLNAEMSFNWKADTASMPINATVSQLLKFGKQPVQIGAGLRYYVESPAQGPDWGLRLNLTFLFPAG